MLARKCDVCSKFHEFNDFDDSEDFNTIDLIDSESNGNKHKLGSLELCPDCVDELKKLIRSRMENKYGRK